MKKNLKLFWGFFILGFFILYFPLTSNAGNNECNHEWTITGDYAMCNEQYHYAVVKCKKCGVVNDTLQKQPHSLDIIENYREYNSDYHWVDVKCKYCEYSKSIREEHDIQYQDNYTILDSKYHKYIYGFCRKCNTVVSQKQKHDWDYLNSGEYEYINNTYHQELLICNDCGYPKFNKYKHTKSDYDDYKVIKYATLYSKAKLSYICDDCFKKVIKYVPWKKNSEYSRSYDITHNTIWNKDKKVIIYLENPSKGAVVKLKVGRHKYSYKIKNNKKKIKFKIKKATYGQKISMNLYYKGKKIGSDYCNDDNRVWYSDKVRVGMTKNQVKYTWGSPGRKSTSSNGYTYWFWGDGSYVGFRKGHVKFWYNAAA